MIPLAPAVSATASLPPPAFDARWPSPSDRIRALVNQYLTVEHLRDRLEDLPNQLAQPHLRPWRPLPWAEVSPDQVVGIDPATCCRIIAGAMVPRDRSSTINTEAPIRGYTQSSRQYLSDLYPAMARFVGGTVDGQGQLVELGLWEREEKRHLDQVMRRLWRWNRTLTPDYLNVLFGPGLLDLRTG